MTGQPAPGHAADASATVSALGIRTEDIRYQRELSVDAESRPRDASVGLLAWRCRACSAPASPSPAHHRVVVRSGTLTHSGGTAPELRRLPCYALRGHRSENGLIPRSRPGRQIGEDGAILPPVTIGGTAMTGMWMRRAIISASVFV